MEKRGKLWQKACMIFGIALILGTVAVNLTGKSGQKSWEAYFSHIGGSAESGKLCQRTIFFLCYASAPYGAGSCLAAVHDGFRRCRHVGKPGLACFSRESGFPWEPIDIRIGGDPVFSLQHSSAGCFLCAGADPDVRKRISDILFYEKTEGFRPVPETPDAEGYPSAFIYASVSAAGDHLRMLHQSPAAEIVFLKSAGGLPPDCIRPRDRQYHKSAVWIPPIPGRDR